MIGGACKANQPDRRKEHRHTDIHQGGPAADNAPSAPRPSPDPAHTMRVTVRRLAGVVQKDDFHTIRKATEVICQVVDRDL